MTKYKEIKIDIKVSPEVIINEMLKQMLEHDNNKQEINDESKQQ